MIKRYNYKKLAVACLSVFFLCVISESIQNRITESKFDTSGWSKYSSNLAKISFLYPEDYQISEIKNDSDIDIIIRDKNQTDLSSNPWMKIKIIENSSNTNFYFGLHVRVRDRITIKGRHWKLYTPPMPFYNYRQNKDSVMVFWNKDTEYDIFLHHLRPDFLQKELISTINFE